MGLLDRPQQPQRYGLLSPDVMSLIQSVGSRPAPAPAAPAAPRRERVSGWRVFDRVLGGQTVTQGLDAERARLEAEARAPQERMMAQRELDIAQQFGGGPAWLALRANREEFGGQLSRQFAPMAAAEGTAIVTPGQTNAPPIMNERRAVVGDKIVGLGGPNQNPRELLTVTPSFDDETKRMGAETGAFRAEEDVRQGDARLELDRDRLSQESRQFLERIELDRETAQRTGQNQSIERETGLRREFSALPEVRAFNEVSTSYQNVLAAANDPTAAGDLSMIFAYMKMLDPGSVVREQEFANAQNAAGVPDQVRNAWNRALRGERLNAAQRGDFSAQARSLYRNRRERYDQLEDEFTGYARDYGADPSRVVGGERADPAAGQRLSPQEASRLPPGTRFIGTDGVERVRQ